MHLDTVLCGDCNAGMSSIPSASIDLVFADLPSGITQNEWDVPIELHAMWSHLKRIAKPRAPFVFVAVQPFASLLLSTNPTWFRYEMIWRKNKPRGFLNAKKQPLRAHENVLVFYGQQPVYVPQMTDGHPPVHHWTKHKSDGTNYGATRRGVRGGGSTRRYPTSVLEIPVVNENDPERTNATQKPEELAAWYIRTYTRPGDVVFDPTIGSGSTLAAAKKLGRRYCGFDTDPLAVASAIARLNRIEKRA